MQTLQRFRLLTLVLALIIGSVWGVAAPPALAIGGAAVVNNLGDSANDNNASTCTLREALQVISEAKTVANPPNRGCAGIQQGINTITFSINGTITVASSLPDISSNISITGPIIINGSGSADTPIFRVSTSDAIFNLAGVTLTKGEPAILGTTSGSIMNIAGSSFVGNVNSGNGGAISSDGALNIAGTNFTGNRANGTDGGGAIWASGTDQLNIAGSVFNGNTAKRSGGAIYALAPGTIVDTIFNGNIAEGLDPNNNGTEGDPADDYFPMGGGALVNRNDSGNGRKMVIIRSVFNGNLAAPKANAGALYNHSGATVEIRDSSFNGNLAGSTGLDRLGGAILNAGARLSINRVTLLNNGVTGDGGGIAIDRGNIVDLTNMTIVANAASGKGGGIYAFNTQQNGSSNIRAESTLRNLTISLNVATSGGGIYGQAPTSSYPEPHKLANTLLSGNLPDNCAIGPFTSLGHNLDSATSCALTGTGDLQNANADLQGPAFNGGPLAELLSQKLGPVSAAADAGDPAICAASPVDNLDQRSTARPIGLVCDIGAYEAEAFKAGYGSAPVQPGPIDIGNVQLGTTGQKSFTIFSTGNKDLQLGATIQGANASEFAIVAFPATVSSSATATVSCTPGVAGQRAAALVVTTNDPVQPTVVYDLLCNGTPQPVAGFGSVPAAPGPIDFGAITLGLNKSINLTVLETGNATLSVTGMQLGGPNPGDFALSTTDISIADGAAPVVRAITCTPGAAGIRSATLSMATNDPVQPVVTFNLSCVGKPVASPVLGIGAPYSGGGILGMTGPYGVALSPDGRNLYVASTNGVMTVFSRSTTSGALNFVQEFVEAGGLLNGAIRVLVSPDGASVYVTAASANRVLSYARNTSSGILSLRDSATENDPTFVGSISGLSGAYGMAISADSRFLYVSGTSDANSNTSIIVFALDSDGGLRNSSNVALVQSMAVDANLKGTYDLALSPDGAHLYAANYGGPTRSITMFKRNANTGVLTTPGTTIDQTTVPGLSGVFRLAFSPDGNHLYASSYDSDKLNLFQRNAATGVLTFIETYTDGQIQSDGEQIDGLNSSSSAKVSPDGRYVYTTGYSDNAVAVFERDPATGKLDYLAQSLVKRDTNTGLPPLAGARDLVISADGRHVYATAFTDNKVVHLPLANPKPSIQSLSPASATAGSGAIILTVNGTGFVPSSIIKWNGANLTNITYVGEGEIRGTVAAGLLTTAGSASVTVFSPTPGGGTSNTLSFTITAPAENPVPSIDQISPQGAPAGGPAISLTVSGAGFLPSSQVVWNGSARPTTYISGSTLQAQIPGTDVAQPGASAVTVVNPAPGGGSSNAVAFTVATPGQNPPPSLNLVSPNSTVAGQTTGQLTLSLYGSGFVAGVKAQWNGVNRPTILVNSGELRVDINAADVATAGQSSVTVTNPVPGGGKSNSVGFTVVAVGENPLPSLGSASVSGFNPDGTIVLAITGFGFISGTQVRWNGSDRATTVASPTQLLVTVPAADYAAGSAVLIATNPAPGGGTSNELLYQVRRLGLPVLVR